MTCGRSKNVKQPFLPRKLTATYACMMVVTWLCVFFTAALGRAQDESTRNHPTPFRIALSGGTFVTANPYDAQAAVKAWAKTILQQRGIVQEVQTRIFQSTEALFEALNKRQVDAAAMLTEEFMKMEDKPDSVFLSMRKNSFTEQYVLLVHRNSGIDDIDKLLGRKLLLHSNPKTSLASAWLDTLLAEQSLGFPEQVLESKNHIENASKAVLQVFFGQTDACIVTANVFAVVSELNPQVRNTLRVIATSPEVIPSLFFFRSDYTMGIRDSLEEALVGLHESPSGQQVLMIFQGDQMKKKPASCLENSRKLVQKAQRLRRPLKGGEKSPLSQVRDNAKN